MTVRILGKIDGVKSLESGEERLPSWEVSSGTTEH